jgi:hypothetical protein
MKTHIEDAAMHLPMLCRSQPAHPRWGRPATMAQHNPHPLVVGAPVPSLLIVLVLEIVLPYKHVQAPVSVTHAK